MEKMNKTEWQQLKDDHPIATVVGNAIKLKKVGQEFTACCPFHAEKNASFTVVPAKQFAHCFGCGWHGNVAQFVAAFNNIPMWEAIDFLTGGKKSKQSDEDIAKRERIMQEREEEERQYREKAIRRARTIWDNGDRIDPFHPYLVRKDVSASYLQQNSDGLILVPVFGPDGEIQSIQTIDDAGKKKNLPGAPMAYGRMNVGIFAGRKILCEGYATAASINDATADMTVVTFGVENMEKVAREMAEAGEYIILAPDTGTIDRMVKLGRELDCPVVSPATDLVFPDTGEIGKDFNDQAQIRGNDDVAKAFKVAIKAFAQEKTRRDELRREDTGPVDLWAKPEPPDFPLGIFPDKIERMAVARGEQIGCDPAGIAIAGIVACGAAISDTITLKMNRNEPWWERACMWGLLIGVPSTNKSAMLKVATGKIKEIDKGMMLANNRAMLDWQDAGGTKSGDPSPPHPRLRIEDTTMEAAQEVCRYSPDGILSIQDEMEGFFGGIEKYAGGKGGGRDRSFWIGAYNGGSYTVNRIGRGGPGGFIIDNLSMSMIGGIQPDPVKRIMSGLSDNGLMQRFMPIVLKDGYFGEDKPIPPVAEEYDGLIEQLHSLRIKREGGFFLRDYLEFDDEAQEIQYRTSRFHFERMKALESVNPMLSTHMGKFNGFFGRLCIIWHCIEHAGEELPQKISVETASKVEAFLHDFLMAHSTAFYVGMLGMTPDHDRLTAVAGYIVAHKLETVTMRTIGQNVRAMKKIDRQEAAAVFEQLEALGWLEQDHKRKDAPSWKVDPQVHIKFEMKGLKEAEQRAEVRKIIAETVEDRRAARRGE